MKDIVITSRTLIRELYVLLICFAAATAVNVYAILKYDRPWNELWLMIGFVIAITAGLYAAQAIIRGIIALIKALVRR